MYVKIAKIETTYRLIEKIFNLGQDDKRPYVKRCCKYKRALKET